MRRSLVVTDESARHPFRQSLPPHVRRGTEPVPARRRGWRISASLRQFLSAYCASFVAVTIFFA